MKIQIFRSRKTGDWHFRFRARNGEIMAQSEGYRRLPSVLTALRAMVLALNGPMTLDDGKGKPRPIYLAPTD